MGTAWELQGYNYECRVAAWDTIVKCLVAVCDTIVNFW